MKDGMSLLHEALSKRTDLTSPHCYQLGYLDAYDDMQDVISELELIHIKTYSRLKEELKIANETIRKQRYKWG